MQVVLYLKKIRDSFMLTLYEWTYFVSNALWPPRSLFFSKCNLSKDLNIWKFTFLMKFSIIFITTVTLSTPWLTFLWKTFNLVLGMEYIWSSSEGVWCDGSQGFHCFQSAPWFNSVLVWSSAWSGDPYSYTSPLAPVTTLLLMAGKKIDYNE